MNITVYPSSLTGVLKAPSSKSHTIRAIAAAMLAGGTSQIYFPSRCDDALAMADIARLMGAEITENPDNWNITTRHASKPASINCGESGLATRLMIAIAAHNERETIITGSGTLLNRHLGNIEQPLISLGATCKTYDGKLPFTIRGPIKGGSIEVDGTDSSQFISGLLMALPLAKNDSELRVHNLKSIPYVDMTLEILGKFGIEVHQQQYGTFTIEGNQKYKPACLEIEGDWSGASFAFVAAALAGNIDISRLNPHSQQADKKIMSAITKASVDNLYKNSTFHSYKSEINSFDFDATHCPDLFPPLAVLAAAAKGTSTISGAGRLSQKESNRGAVLQVELAKLGIKIDLKQDVMIVEGGKIRGGTIFSHHDHRIAMAGTVAALIADGPVTIQDAECVSKSYPDFFKDMETIGVRMKLV